MRKILTIGILLSSVLYAQSADEIMKANGCFSCHAIASRKAAPAFAGIGKRNKRFEGIHAKATIMNSIKNGSKGKYPRFANSAMPAFSNLSEKELSTVADYILSQSSKAHCNGRRGHGMERGMR